MADLYRDGPSVAGAMATTNGGSHASDEVEWIEVEFQGKEPWQEQQPVLDRLRADAGQEAGGEGELSEEVAPTSATST